MQSAPAVREHLKQVLNSRTFARADAVGRMLHFLVEGALDGRRDDLSEYTIATRVFGRKAEFDPQADSIVRVQASRLRSKLQEYYGGEGSADALRIELVRGSYIPTFSTHTARRTAPTVAVLVFQNFTGDPEFEYFTDGLTEEVINVLTRIDGLHVVARTSMFAVKGQALDVREIGARLGANVVLEGSVRRAGAMVRVTVQGIDALSGLHIFSTNYDREMGHLFELQDHLSTRVLDELRARLAPQIGRTRPQRQPAPEAYALYLKGRHMFRQLSPATTGQAMAFYQQAIEADAEFSQPYAGLSEVTALLGWIGFIPPHDAFPRVRHLAETALALDPQSADAFVDLSFVRAYEWDAKAALELVERAIEVEPGASEPQWIRSYWLLATGRKEEAVIAVRRGAALDPLNPMAQYNIGFVHWMAGRDDDALAEFDRVMEMTPGYAEALCNKGVLLAGRGQLEEALACFEVGCKAHGGIYGLEYFPYIYGLMGERRKAEQALTTLLETAGKIYVAPLRISLAYSGMGEHERAFEALEQAADLREARHVWLKVWPVFRRYHGHPRFEALARRVNNPVT